MLTCCHPETRFVIYNCIQQKDTSDAYVVWFSEDYQADTETPWCINEVNDNGTFDTSDEIALLSDIRLDIEDLVCCLIIGGIFVSFTYKNILKSNMLNVAGLNDSILDFKI